jgi:putative redox protein
MPAVTVQHVDGDRFTIGIRDHLIAVDQPVTDGGDTAPTPTELFVASLASCVAFYARRYLATHKLPTTGLRVTPSTGWGHTQRE